MVVTTLGPIAPGWEGIAVVHIQQFSRFLRLSHVPQRMSGIASATRAMVAAASPHGAKVLETRKTVPGLRLLDKWAVLIGGWAKGGVLRRSLVGEDAPPASSQMPG